MIWQWLLNLGKKKPILPFISRGDHFRFGSVFIKKNNQTKIIIFLKKKTETEPKPGQTDRFRFGFFRAKTGSNRFGSVFPVWLGFFPVFCRFRFGFFGFLVIKPNRTSRFFQKFNRFNRFFFSGSVFSVIFFPVFSV